MWSKRGLILILTTNISGITSCTHENNSGDTFYTAQVRWANVIFENIKTQRRSELESKIQIKISIGRLNKTIT